MTAQPNNVIIKYPSTGTVTRQITIGTRRVEENYTKAITTITPPKSTNKQSIEDGKSDSIIVDILRQAERRWTVDGILMDDDEYVTGDTSTDAAGKRDNLREVFFAGGTFLVNIEGTDYIVNSDKISIIWEVDDQSVIDQYDVKFTVVEGKNLGA